MLYIQVITIEAAICMVILAHIVVVTVVYDQDIMAKLSSLIASSIDAKFCKG